LQKLKHIKIKRQSNFPPKLISIQTLLPIPVPIQIQITILTQIFPNIEKNQGFSFLSQKIPKEESKIHLKTKNPKPNENNFIQV